MGKLYHLLTLLILILSSGFVSARQCTAVSSGDWSSGSTWSCGSAPTCGDTLTIASGFTVTVTQQEDYSGCADALFIIVEGTLDFSSGKKLTLPTGSGLLVKTGGEIIGAGGGKANIIDIGGTSVWTSASGNITTPTVLGTPLITDVISIGTGNWSNTAIWDCGCVPDSLNNITIDAGHSIVLNANNSAKNFTIKGTFSSSGAFTLDVGGDWDNQGVFTTSSETIRFDGGIAQNIIGTVGQTFTNITVAQGSSVANSTGTITLTGNLLIESGSFDCANNFVLQSNGSGTGNIGDLTNGTFTGNIIYNRLVPAGATSWRFFSSAISGKTISDWNDDFITSGFSGSDYPTFSFTSIYSYDETVLDVKDSGFVPVASVGDNLTPGKGFWVWAGDNSAGTAAFTLDLVGAINQGSIGLPVSFSSSGVIGDDGWNMVGNPYPCAIDWDAAGWTKTNMDNAVYIWDPNSGAYASYVAGVGNNGGSNIIASGQAFWVKSFAASPVLTAVESVKSISLADPFKSFAAPSLIKLTIISSDSNTRDETTFNVSADATLNYDGKYDASKLKSEYQNALYLCSKSADGYDLSINSFSVERDMEIPIYIQVPTSGVYGFDFQNLGGLEEIACAHIRNETTGEILEFSESMIISQSIPATNTPFQRFTLLISAKNKITYTAPSCAQVADGKLEVDVIGRNAWSGVCIDQNNLAEYTATVISDSSLIIEGLSSGLYQVSIEDSSICPARSSEINIPDGEPIIALFDSGVANFVLLDDYNLVLNNESSNSIEYFWDFGDGNTSLDSMPEHLYTVPGKYEIKLIAYKNEICVDSTIKSVVVLDVPFGDSENISAHLFPNSISNGEEVIIHFNQNVNSANVKIIALNGKVVFNKSLSVNGTQAKMPIENLSSGLYLFNIIVEGDIIPFKLTIK